MSNCDNFTTTKVVGKCGNKLYLGKITGLTGNESIMVQYFINGDEVIEMTDPIINGDDISLDLSDPYIDFYSQYYTYFVWVVDVTGYYSDIIPVSIDGVAYDGFIVNFGNVSNSNDKIIIA